LSKTATLGATRRRRRAAAPHHLGQSRENGGGVECNM
jgi:hypothetical protein